MALEAANNFSFLRLLLASLVLLSHAPELIDGNRGRELFTLLTHQMSFGELAVDGFFVISGFLVTKSWVQKPGLLAFLDKRVRRIYPGFIVSCILSALVVGPLAAASSAYFSQFNYYELLMTTLRLQVPLTPPVFPGHSYAFVNGSLWTISYEALCYLIVAAFGLLGMFRRRALWPLFLAGCFAIWVNLNTTLFLHPLSAFLAANSFPEVFRFLSYFFAGTCFYLFHSKIRYFKFGAAIAAVALYLSVTDATWFQLTLMACGSYLLFAFAFAQIPVLKSFQKAPDISYGVYLYGWPTQKLLIQFIPGISPWILFPASLLICCGLGLLSWHLVEKHFMRKRKQIQRNPNPALALV